MRHDLIVSDSIDILTSSDRVWRVLTTPELIKKYLFGTETITDWHVGSEIIFQGDYNGLSYRDKGVILENKPNRLLSYSYWSGFSGLADKPENYSVITYTLRQKGDELTEFTWTQQGYTTEEGYNHSINGMAGLLRQLKELAEQN